MFKHILIPTDGSELSDKGVKQTIKMAKAVGAHITAVHVVPNYSALFQDEGFAMPDIPDWQKLFDDSRVTRAKEILDRVKKAADKAGVKCDTVAAHGDMPYEMIIEQAEKSRCDLIMMASHGRKGMQRLLLGSETAKVLTHSTIPVLVLR
ncbi:MAG: universal stress protein [Burkholderiales bacterium]|jgi:nucleotide-binding universal stress UspA family protein